MALRCHWQARKALRITDEQLTRCYELQQYAKLGAASVGGESAKPWRLCLKRRLLKLHQEEVPDWAGIEPTRTGIGPDEPESPLDEACLS